MPSTISFLNKDILIGGVSTQQVVGTLKASGLAEQHIGEILGWWYVGATGASRPLAFDFVTDVQQTDPTYDITYSRQFTHTDWVDGEDRVQASATPEELGFNARFHGIENEFDAIREQFLRLATGIRDIRADLVGVVRELESKITSLQNDLYELRQQIKPAQQAGPGILGTVKVGDKHAYIAQTGNDFQLVEFAGMTLGESVKPRPADVTHPGQIFDPVLAGPRDVLDVVAGLEDLVTTPSILEVVERPDATIVDLRSAVGGAVLPSGVTAASVLATLPADQVLTGAAGTVESITTQLLGLLPESTTAATRAEMLVDDATRSAPAAKLGSASAAAVGVSPSVVGAARRCGDRHDGARSVAADDGRRRQSPRRQRSDGRQQRHPRRRRPHSSGQRVLAARLTRRWPAPLSPARATSARRWGAPTTRRRTAAPGPPGPSRRRRPRWRRATARRS